MVDLTTEFAGIILKNPVITASGTFGYGEEFGQLIDLNLLGGIVVKGLSIEPMLGTQAPRLHETASGMLNAIGLQNIGVRNFVSHKLPYLRGYQTKIFANIFGYTSEDYLQVVDILNKEEGIAGYEVNISCPNVKKNGQLYGDNPSATYDLIKVIKQESKCPVIVKLSPNVTDITVLAKAAQDGGADALSLINTVVGLSVDVETFQPRLGNITGGLSGPAIKPIALRMTHQVVQTVDLPVIAIGGIQTAHDALEFLLLGAKAVQIGTANFLDPRVSLKIIQGIENYCEKKGFSKISSLIGKFQTD